MFNVKNRTVVQLVDADEIASPYQKANVNFSVKIKGMNTLFTSLKGAKNSPMAAKEFRNIRFDCVSGPNDGRFREEMDGLMDRLIVANETCCLMCFHPVSSCRALFLCNLLVTKVDQRMQYMQGTIHKIVMECYDVRKYDMLNRLGRQANRNAPVADKKKVEKSKVFTSTLELLKWLQDEYRHQWPQFVGHECFEFEFSYFNGQREPQKAKLTLMQIYTDRMDSDTKKLVVQCLECVNREPYSSKSSMLTDCMREYFEEPTRTWLIFRLHVVDVEDVVSDDILKMACATVDTSPRFESNFSLISNTESSSMANESLSNLKVQRSLSKDKSNIIQVCNFRSKAGRDQPPVVVKSGGKGDLNSLSYWYCQMDEKFAKLISAMDDYYDQVYDTKTERFCKNISHMMKTIDNEKVLQEVTFADVHLSDVGERIRKARQRYHDLVIEFRSLKDQIEHSSFGEMLEQYLKTKSIALTQHAFQCKEKHLENCHQRITNTIEKEMSALHSMKNSNSIVSIECSF